MERSLVRTGSESGRKVSKEVIRLYIIHSERVQDKAPPAPDRLRPGFDHSHFHTGFEFNSAHTVKLAEKMVRDSVAT